MQALHLNKSPWAALELHPTPFYSVYLFQVFSAVGNIFWLATDSSHFLREIFIYEIQTMPLNHFICHMCSRQEYCYNVCILVQVCLLLVCFFFFSCTRILLPDSLLYMGCFASPHVHLLEQDCQLPPLRKKEILTIARIQWKKKQTKTQHKSRLHFYTDL